MSATSVQVITASQPTVQCSPQQRRSVGVMASGTCYKPTSPLSMLLSTSTTTPTTTTTRTPSSTPFSANNSNNNFRLSHAQSTFSIDDLTRSPTSGFNFSFSKLKFWKRSANSITITSGELTQKVIYLGNVLTAWAKGDHAVNRALDTLWLNHCRRKVGVSTSSPSSQPDITMRLTVCNQGLKAETRQFGLTEYWASRVTYTAWRAAHPRLFCWVYRHIGRRGKPELRVHAVLCSREEVAKRMAEQLQDRIVVALKEFVREKTARARESLIELPARKRMLAKGAANFRPPVERSKSAPRLMSIVEECIDEAAEEEAEMLRLMFEQKFTSTVAGDLDTDEDDFDLMSLNEDCSDKHHFDDDETDSAIDSESFKSDEVNDFCGANTKTS